MTGSPPLARGTLSGLITNMFSDRLTPARAGNTECQICDDTGFSAHPRSRGEHRTKRKQPLPCAGSPPLARGTR